MEFTVAHKIIARKPTDKRQTKGQNTTLLMKWPATTVTEEWGLPLEYSKVAERDSKSPIWSQNLTMQKFLQ